ncbi:MULTISPECIES: GNAT family N-acetyltransferase [unclassified Leifsonia]|uniref:GNAT family N-acetyltransferase n=1 Tax=unclassified Leifsonia TaxID=2663824 RepID=UPI0006F53A3A|nr:MULTISPECIES: GNAT family N-acetyltransferase [unclassified Leifsonia]KQX08069.1 hypothetical protein ASC59_10325 [Leifsonia sp. Root1293]KRA12350.1 hypothetical protein ASD61_10325 [Leifsonia sp. Root60]
MDQPVISVRPATIADADAVWPMARDFATTFRPDEDAYRATFPLLLQDPDALLIVAEAEGRVVGYLLADAHRTFLANGPVAWVEEVKVTMRRSGVGSALMAAAEDWARDVVGAPYLALASRRASDFYAALGYEESAVFWRKMLPGPPVE